MMMTFSYNSPGSWKREGEDCSWDLVKGEREFTDGICWWAHMCSHVGGPRVRMSEVEFLKLDCNNDQDREASLDTTVEKKISFIMAYWLSKPKKMIDHIRHLIWSVRRVLREV
ncbi:hypothetical protein MRB53_015073 [Persea americana]|uniref:Uncharacterized protein n=1 Tax=Persea americana TaxID=3435 RepID=A0ACC2KD38_PERAE|nr:hypothetical protein MRB53_015073 [Persea americana]